MQQHLIQILMAFLGTIGFSLFFNIKKSRLLLAGCGGALIWAIYLVFFNCSGENEMMALVAASATASLLAEILARVVKSPVTVLLMPMLIPLIPGGNLYYTMFNLVQGRHAMFQTYLQLVLREAASIAVGIIVVTTFAQVIQKSGSYREKMRGLQRALRIRK